MAGVKERVSIKYITEKYGNDLTDVDLSRYVIDVSDSDISNIVLPKDKDFFKRLSGWSVCGATLPEGDYSVYDFEGVDIDGAVFTERSTLPEDKDLFLKVCNRNLYNTTLPEADYSEHCFDDVYISDTVFTENSVFSKDKNVFQKICNRSLYGTVLPKGDYRGYNFKGVNCSMARFTFDSLLPEDIKLLQTINSSFDGDYEDDYVMGEEGFILTKNVIENMHRYDLSGIKIDLRDYEDYLTEGQLSIIRVKCKNDLGVNIILPEKGLLRGNQEVKARNIKNELSI